MHMNMLFTRRSIRRFQEQPVEQEKIERLLRAAMQAPSAKNMQPWEFLVVTDAEDRKAVSTMSPYSGMCVYAPLVIIVMENTECGPHTAIYHQQDLAAATQNILLQAVEEGLGAVWCGCGPDENKMAVIRDYFKLPEHIKPFSVIAIGYSEKENCFVDRYLPERVHYGKW